MTISIYLADNDNGRCSYMKELLTVLARKKGIQIQITEFENGQQCIQALESGQPPSVVISAWEMPIADGLDVAKIVYEMNPRPQFMIYSGNTNKEFQAKAQERGLNHQVLFIVSTESSKLQKTFKAALQ